MRVAIFTDTYTPDINGVALTLDRWVTYLRQHHHEVIVFAPEGEERLSDEEQIKRYKSFPFVLYPELQAAFPNPIDIDKQVVQFQPDIIHVATPFNLGLFGRRYALKHNIPFVASYHTHFDQYLESYKLIWAKSFLNQYLCWFHQECQAVFAPSKQTANQLKDQSYPEVKIWPRGVNHQVFKPPKCKVAIKKLVAERYQLSDQKINVLYVGRLSAEKSIMLLIDAVKALPITLRFKIQVFIVGDGPIRHELEAEIKKYHLPIHLLGFLEGESLAQIYQASDLFFFPSSTETFGNVILEALSSGLPVIGANAGGVKELVVSAHNGILCPANHIDSFVEALIFLLSNPSVRKYYGQNARNAAMKFNWNHIFDDFALNLETIIRVNKQIKLNAI